MTPVSVQMYFLLWLQSKPWSWSRLWVRTTHWSLGDSDLHFWSQREQSSDERRLPHVTSADETHLRTHTHIQSFLYSAVNDWTTWLYLRPVSRDWWWIFSLQVFYIWSSTPALTVLDRCDRLLLFHRRCRDDRQVPENVARAHPSLWQETDGWRLELPVSWEYISVWRSRGAGWRLTGHDKDKPCCPVNTLLHPEASAEHRCLYG